MDEQRERDRRDSGYRIGAPDTKDELEARLNVALKTALHGRGSLPKDEVARILEAKLREFGFMARVYV